jgi:transcriptional regulator with XRE-family HTH domain
MRTSQPKNAEISNRIRNFRNRIGMSQQELGKRLGISGNYVYLIESGQKSPGPSLLKLFETMEVSPLYQGEFSKEGSPRFSEASALGVYDRLGTETLKQNIADQASHLPTADPHTVFSIIESMREMMSILSTRLRPRPEASSKPPSELQAAAKRASASAKTDPSE